MLAQAFEFLQEHLGRAKGLAVDDGRTVFDREVFNPPRPDLPIPKPRTFSTLVGLAQYVTANPDFRAFPGSWMIHVSSPHVVELCDCPNINAERTIQVRATCPTQEDAGWLDRWVTQEDMLIGLLGVAEGADRDALVKGVQSIRREGCEVTELADGGQQAQATFKIGMTEWLKTDGGGGPLDLGKVVRLAPYRTFSEIEQPVGSFIFRIKGGDGGTSVKLVPTPDATWSVVAVTSVKAKLDELLAGVENAPPVIC